MDYFNSKGKGFVYDYILFNLNTPPIIYLYWSIDIITLKNADVRISFTTSMFSLGVNLYWEWI